MSWNSGAMQCLLGAVTLQFYVQFYVQLVVLVGQVAGNTTQCSAPDAAVQDIFVRQVTETISESITWSNFLQ